ncbi:MAG: hypothetical protein O3A21_07870, partial [Proteobacteria bacterium]|nr:hypothetical protein [Pseudomonadota bacterium]
MTDVELVVHTEDVLGEVPIWCPREQALYWMDGFKPALHRFDGLTGAVVGWTPPEKFGSFALSSPLTKSLFVQSVSGATMMAS